MVGIGVPSDQWANHQALPPGSLKTWWVDFLFPVKWHPNTGPASVPMSPSCIVCKPRTFLSSFWKTWQRMHSHTKLNRLYTQSEHPSHEDVPITTASVLNNCIMDVLVATKNTLCLAGFYSRHTEATSILRLRTKTGRCVTSAGKKLHLNTPRRLTASWLLTCTDSLYMMERK